MRNQFIVMMLFNQERPTEISNLMYKCDLWLLDFVNCKDFDLFDFYGYHSSFVLHRNNYGIDLCMSVRLTKTFQPKYTTFWFHNRW